MTTQFAFRARTWCGLAALLLIAWACGAPAGSHPLQGSGGTAGPGSGGGAGTGAGLGTGGTAGSDPCAAMCNGVCTAVANDPGNCGTCGNVCPATTTCVSGMCTSSAQCSAGLEMCGGVCADVTMNVLHCGGCNVLCSTGESCSGGSCVCEGTLTDCGSGCIDTMTSAAHCGGCNAPCAAELVCSLGTCSTECAQGLSRCDQSCVDPMTDEFNCGDCGEECGASQECVGGSCSCTTAGEVACGGTCVNTVTNAAHCGMCDRACAAGQTCSGGTCMGGNVDNCAVTAGTISNFENQSLDVATHNGWTGAWEAFKGAGGTHTMAVEKWGTETCNQYALHTRGSGVTQYVGIGVNLTGTPTQPTVYNGSAWTGVRFKARLGGATTSAVRFNISTPWTEGSENPGGLCTGTGCYNHVGRFLHQENALTNDWKQFTFCFDRDLYPQFLPSNLSATQRRQVASNILKLQFVFNVAKNLSQSPPAEYAKTEPFDFWLDDIELVADSCDTRPQPFTSSSGTAKPFPQNGAAGTVGSCTRATDANKFSHTIAEAYLRWKTNFVRAGNPGQRVLSPEQGDDTPSEAMGYGMLIAAAMGDKAMFDQFWTYVNSQLVSGLMKWSRNGNGSATDADQDIAYALALGASQWGGDYAARATTMINAISSRDLQAGNRIGPGSDWGSTPAFNASYVAPSYYPVFQALTGSSTWATIKSANYTNVSNCTQWFSGGTLPADWCNVSTSQAVPGENFGAAVLSFPGVAVYAFDAARVPWRVALDACLFDSSTARSYLNTLVGFFTSRYTNGETIDRMLAGWRSDLTAHPNAQENQMSFIGPVGVAAMATTHTATRERAFRAVLDIMENPEFNRTYYPTTVGLITLLQMSGNFPHRTN